MANMYPSKKASGGGGLNKTTLWTNSTKPFSKQTVTLSGNISDYDYLEFGYWLWPGGNDYTEGQVMIPVSLFTSMIETASGQRALGVSLCASSGTTRYYRFIFYVSDTQITFNTCLSSGSYNDGMAVPIHIKGIKI